MPPVSVVIPTHDRARVVARAVRSVLACLEDGDEVVVVDDGSSDDTGDVLCRFGDAVRCVTISHSGAARARNVGIATARHPLIGFLDSDDEWMSGKLCVQRAVLTARPELAFCFMDFAVRRHGRRADRKHVTSQNEGRTWCEILGPGAALSALTSFQWSQEEPLVYIGDFSLSSLERPYVHVNTLLVNRYVAGDALTFAEDLPIYEDWECVDRLARAGAAAYIDCDGAWQNYDADARFTDGIDGYTYASARLTTLERLWGRDEDFLRAHGDRYSRAVAIQRRVQAASLRRR